LLVKPTFPESAAPPVTGDAGTTVAVNVTESFRFDVLAASPEVVLSAEAIERVVLALLTDSAKVVTPPLTVWL